jgi:hypothetical protein
MVILHELCVNMIISIYLIFMEEFMKKRCSLLLVFAMISLPFASCVRQSADEVLNEMESQIEKIEELATNMKLKSIEDIDKWQDGFMRLSTKLMRHKDNMTPEQILRLNQLITKGSDVTEKIYNGGYTKDAINGFLDEMEALVKEIDDLAKAGKLETVDDDFLEKWGNNYKRLISQLNARQDNMTNNQRARLNDMEKSLEKY